MTDRRPRPGWWVRGRGADPPRRMRQAGFGPLAAAAAAPLPAAAAGQLVVVLSAKVSSRTSTRRTRDLANGSSGARYTSAPQSLVYRCRRNGHAALARGDSSGRRRTTTEHGRDEGDDRGFRRGRAGDVAWRARRSARVRVLRRYPSSSWSLRSVSLERMCSSRAQRRRRAGRSPTTEHGRDEGDDRGFQHGRAGDVA